MKNILITAGNTWSPIDDVRVITNIFSGETGLNIAKQCAKKGFKVTLILADLRSDIKLYFHKNIKIIRAITFNELYETLKTEIKNKKYNYLIQAASISDFKVKQEVKGKIKSGFNMKLRLIPTKKIVNKIKKWDSEIKLIKFKLEAESSRKQLIQIAIKSKKESNADLVIANNLPQPRGKHSFIIIKSRYEYVEVTGKKELAKKITKICKKKTL